MHDLSNAQLVGSVLYGADELVATMVADRIPYMGPGGFGQRDPFTGELPYAALGVVRSGKLLGGLVAHNYRPGSRMIEMSGAFDRPDWVRPATLRRLFSYPYVQLGCLNMITFTARSNKRARQIIEFVGFRYVGMVYRAIDGKEDAALYEMPRHKCRWLNPASEKRPSKDGEQVSEGVPSMEAA